MKPGPKRQDVRMRFERHYIPEPNSGCWLWLGHVMWDGYGMFHPVSKRNVRAHRFSYELYKGQIPNGVQLDHVCRVRCCVNPDHLEFVDHRENQRRSPISNMNKTHCRNGHEYNQENTRWIKVKGILSKRRCRKCEKIYDRQNI